MLIKITLKLQKPTLPKDYRPAFVSLIKKCLSSEFPQEFERLYGGNNAVQKSFTFAVKMSAPVFKKEQIDLSGDLVYMSLSTSDMRDGMILYNSFIKNVKTTLPLKNNNGMEIVNVRVIHTPEIKSNEAVIRFISPLVVRNHLLDEKDRYYTFEDDEFQNCLKEVIKRQLMNSGCEEAEVLLEPVKAKKTVILSFGNKIRSTLGIFKIRSTPQVINFLWKAGIGSRRSQGFGMFEILG